MLVLSGAAVQAGEYYFAQDDFVLYFGQPGQPGAAGGYFKPTTTNGYIVDWSVNENVAWFSLEGKTTLGAQSIGGGEYVTRYDTNLAGTSGAVLTIYDGDKGDTSTVLWQGSGWLETQVGLASYTPEARPGYVTEPATYQGKGTGAFVKTSGSWSCPEFDMPWFGSYNWGYDSQYTKQTGNVQGRVECVPEPGTILAALAVLSPVGFVFRRRRI